MPSVLELRQRATSSAQAGSARVSASAEASRESGSAPSDREADADDEPPWNSRRSRRARTRQIVISGCGGVSGGLVEHAEVGKDQGPGLFVLAPTTERSGERPPRVRQFPDPSGIGLEAHAFLAEDDGPLEERATLVDLPLPLGDPTQHPSRPGQRWNRACPSCGWSWRARSRFSRHSPSKARASSNPPRASRCDAR